MKINRQGITRIVLEFKNIVIKMPNFSYQWDHFLLGLIANIRENRAYKWSENKEILCPILWCSWGGWVLIMKRAEVCGSSEELDYSSWIDAGFGGDDKPENYGRINGKVVKLDYGQ